MLHEQAIYQHDGECWQVERFDHENHKAFVRQVEPDYWTDAMTYVQVSVLEESADRSDRGRPRGPSGWGEVAVVEKVVGYKKIKFYTHENAGYGDVRLPEMQMHTTAFWLTVPETRRRRDRGRAAPRRSTRCAASGVALETVATLALCATRATSARRSATRAPAATPRASVPRHEQHGRPAAGVQPDALPLRARPRRHRARRAHLGAARRAPRANAAHDRELPCATGCPACVGPGEATRKAAALDLLRSVVPTA